MADLLLAAWLGGVWCYIGLLLTPTPSRLPLLTVVCLAVVWPLSIALAHADAAPPRGGS